MASTVESRVNINVGLNVDEVQNRIRTIESQFNSLNDSISGLNASSEDWAESLNRVSDSANNISDDTNNIDEDFEVLKQSVGSLASAFGINTGKVSEFTTILGKLSPLGAAAGVGIGVIVTSLNFLNKQAEEALNTFKELAVNTIQKLPDMFSDLAIGGVDLFIDALSNMKNMLEEVIELMNELADIGIDANGPISTLHNYIGSEGARNIENYTNALGLLNGVNITELQKSLTGLYGSLSNTNLNSEELVKYGEAFSNFMNDLSAYNGSSLNEIGGQIEAALSFGILNSRSALARAMDLTDKHIEQFKQLSTVEERAQYILSRWPIFADKYDEWLETDQGKVITLRNQWENLMSSVGQIALRIYAMVAPLLTQVLQVVNVIVSALASLAGVKAVGKDVTINKEADAYDNLADSISGVGNAAKDATRKTASFDDVIQISDSKSSSKSDKIGSSVADASKLNDILKKIGEQQKKNNELLEKWSDIIKKDIELGDFESAGKHFGQFIYEWLTQINWDDINKKVKTLSTNISDFFNGLNSNKSTWLKIGETIGNSFNTITLSIKTFFENFDGAEFGDSLGFMWKNMWDTFDEQQAADALYEVFNDVFEIVGGFLEHGGFMSMAESITKTITGFFADIAENGNASEYAQTLYDLAENIFLSFADAIYTVVTDENTKSVVKEAISTLCSNLAEDADDLANNLVTLVISILEFIGEAIVTPENVNNIVSAIKTFIDTIADNKDKIVEALKPIVETITQALKDLNESGEIKKIFDTIYDICKESGIFDLIGEWMNTQIQIKFEKFWFKLKAIVETIFNNIKDALERGWKNNIGNIVFNLTQQLMEKLGEKIKEMWPAIKSGLQAVWDGFKNWWNKHFGGKNLIDITIPDWIPGVGGKKVNIDIPKLATGGIVTKSTIANIGEAGKEAVLPLDRNTQWMDNFADKLASRLGNNISQPITIDMSKCTKEYYTKSEMISMGEHYAKCLKQAGMNVAVIM